jgi:hypothetical protein
LIGFYSWAWVDELAAVGGWGGGCVVVLHQAKQAKQAKQAERFCSIDQSIYLSI